MAFLVQNDAGGVNDANSYVDVAFFRAYHADRGNDVTIYLDPAVQQALIRATDYLDHRFTFVGERLNVLQRTRWPRVGALDKDDNLRAGVPYEVKEATCEYGFLSLTAALNPEPTRDATGQTVASKSESVGPISESVSYAAGGAFELPRHPVADQRLSAAGLVVGGRSFGRA